jgi:hypothetical protein
MSELTDFACKLIELEGGAADPFAGELVALLPSALGANWQVPEELTLSEHPDATHRLAYGTELLDRMIATAVSRLSVARVRQELPAPRESTVRSAASHFSLRNGVVEARSLRVGLQSRVELHAAATLQGDEQRELIVAAAISPFSNTEVAGYLDAATTDACEPGAELANLSDDTLQAALAACARIAESDAAAFRDGMTRRFERDRGRIEGYFEDLTRELQKRAARGKQDPAAIEAKHAALSADRSAKLEALAARFVLRIAVEPIALRIHDLSGAFISLLLRRRKASRVLELEYDGSTRRIVPPPCDSCGLGAPRPAACDDALHLLCEVCAPRSEGRLACRACTNARARSASVA